MYRNLIITITLGVLSMVAVAGLVMLPIMDVISCTDDDRKWNTSSNNRTANFSAYHKYPDEYNNLGWSVSASLSVSTDGNGYGTASASATPSIVDPDRIVGLWEADNKKISHTFYGNATVKAAVYPASFDAEDRELYEDTPYPHTSLSANVQVKTQRYKVCELESKSRNRTKNLNFKISVEGEIPAAFVKIKGESGYEYTDSNGEVWTVSIEGETTEKIHGLGQITHKEASITGGSDWFVAYATITSFGMNQCSFSDKQVSLSKRDCTLEELGITSYRGLYRGLY